MGFIQADRDRDDSTPPYDIMAILNMRLYFNESI